MLSRQTQSGTDLSGRWQFALVTAFTALFSLTPTPLASALQVSKQELRARYAEAETLVRGGSWDEGLSILYPLTEEYPQDKRLLNLTGLALTGKGKIPEADVYFSRCLTVAPGFLPALKNLGVNEVTLNRLDQAEEHLVLAQRQAPEDKVIRLFLGRLAYARQDFVRASEMLAGAGDLVYRDPNITAQFAASELLSEKKAEGLRTLDHISPEPLSTGMQLTLGVSLFRSGSPELALKYFEAAKRRSPHAEEVNFDLAVCYLSAKRYAEALDAVRQLIADGYENSETDNLLAEAYETGHETQLAIASLRRAITLDPRAEQNYLDFASLCLNHQAYAEGLKVLDVGLEMKPRSDSLLFERGILHAMQDHFDLAEKDFALASIIAPEKDSGTLGLGVTLLETGNSKRATQLLRERLLVSPGNAQLQYLLAESLVRSDLSAGETNYAEAQMLLEQSIEHDPNNGLARVLLGKIYLEHNQLTNAIEQLERARVLRPNERSAYSHLAIAYRRNGEKEKANACLTEIRHLNDREREGAVTKMMDRTPEGNRPVLSSAP